MSDEGVITITIVAVNDAPYAADAAESDEDNAVVINVVSNDTISTAVYGRLCDAGRCTDERCRDRQRQWHAYTPQDNYSGVDVLTYTVDDN